MAWDWWSNDITCCFKKQWGNTSAYILYIHTNASIEVYVKFPQHISSLACMYIHSPTSIYFYRVHVYRSKIRETHRSWETHTRHTGVSFLSFPACQNTANVKIPTSGWKTTESPTFQKLKVEVSISHSESDMKRLARSSFLPTSGF